MVLPPPPPPPSLFLSQHQWSLILFYLYITTSPPFSTNHGLIPPPPPFFSPLIPPLSLAESYPSSGIRSHCPDMPHIRLPWLMTTPATHTPPPPPPTSAPVTPPHALYWLYTLPKRVGVGGWGIHRGWEGGEAGKQKQEQYTLATDFDQTQSTSLQVLVLNSLS